MISKAKKTIIIFILIILIIFIYKEWLFSFSIITKGDWSFLFSETASTLRINYFSLWLSDFSFGRVLLDVAQAPTYSMYGFFAKFFHMDYSISERIIHLWPVIIITPISSFLFVKKIFGKIIPAIIGCIIYSFNTYILSLQTGHLTLMVSFALAPLIIFFFIKTLEEKSFNLGIITGLLSSLSVAYEPRAFYIIVFILFFYYLYHTCFVKNLIINEVFRNSVYAFLPILIIIALNFYWVFGLSKVGTLVSNDLFNRELFGNNFWNIFYSFTLHHPWWSESGIKVFIKQPIPFYFWFVPITAFLGLILNRKNKIVLFFGFISLLGIFLSKQVGEPFTNVYQWLYDNFPGFNAFREASKFYFLIALGYSVLIASFIDWVYKNLNKNKLHDFVNKSILVLVIGLFLINTKPIITGEIGTLFVSRQIPNDYLILKEKLLSENDYSRIFWTPRDSRWGLYTDLHSKVSNVDIIQTQWKNYTKVELSPNQEQGIVSIFDRPFSNSLFDISSIKYVIIPLQDMENEDDFFVDYGGKKNTNIHQWYVDQLDKVDWIKKIDIGTKELAVYENKDYKNPIFLFSELYNLESLQNIENKYNFTQKLNNDFYFTSKNIFDKNLIGINNIFENSNLNGGVIVDNVKNLDGSVKLSKNLNISNLDKYLFLNDQKISQGVINMNKVVNKFEYKNPDYNFNNIILNPSFEDGIWQDKVGDCNNFDKNPILAMGLIREEKSDGNKSLQLEATRHNACTSLKLDVISGGSYLFSFDYQSPNSDHASYYLDFNDKNKTVIKDDLEIKDKNWNTFSKTIKVPEGATTVSLYVYADSTDEKTNIINRYDNFKMIQVPDLTDAYYLVSEPEEKLVEPNSITFDLINPTKKLVHIKGATTPFFLAMSESYHDKWQLQFNNKKINGFFDSWIPFVKPDKIEDEYHYKLNDFLNAWYIDTNEYCTDNNLCIKNADGSYDLEMAIEFFPQRWFYLGLLISGTTLAGCLGYLGYEGVKRIRIKIKKKDEKDN